MIFRPASSWQPGLVLMHFFVFTRVILFPGLQEMLELHQDDDPALGVTGVPIVKWPDPPQKVGTLGGVGGVGELLPFWCITVDVAASGIQSLPSCITSSGEKINFYLRGLLLTKSATLNRLLHCCLCLYGDFQRLLDFWGLFFAFRGWNCPEPPCIFSLNKLIGLTYM